MAETNKYIILGHGTEAPIKFESRNTIKPGYTLITLAQCGVVTTERQVFPIVEAFADPANDERLSNPVANKKYIKELIGGSGINVYTEGMSYPPLSVQLYLDFASADAASRGKRIMKSGVYKFPIDRPRFQIGDISGSYGLFKEIPEYEGGMFPKASLETFTTMFDGSVLPTLGQVTALVEKNVRRVDLIKKELE